MKVKAKSVTKFKSQIILMKKNGLNVPPILYSILGVFDLKQRGSDRSVFDIKVPRERFESISVCMVITLMSYTDPLAHARKAKR